MPRSRAFLATGPAAIITEGLDVLVQLVMAAMTTSPSLSRLPSAMAAETGRSASPAGFGHHLAEGAAGTGKDNAVLRPLRTGKAGFHVAEIEFENVGKEGFLVAAPQSLFLRVGLDETDFSVRAPGEGKIVDGLSVDRKEPRGGAVFRRHVRDRGAVRQGEVPEPVAGEFDESADDPLFAQHLRDPENEIGGGRAFPRFADKTESDDLGNQHRDRLAQHRRFRLDTAHAPAEDREGVHHRGMAVGSNQGVRTGDAVVRPHDLRQVLDIDLMADAGSRRHHPQVVECRLGPAQEPVAFLVAFHLPLDVVPEGIRAGEAVHLHGVIDDEVDGGEGIDAVRVAAERGHGIAHGGKVDHRRHAGEVLHEDPHRSEGDLPAKRIASTSSRQGRRCRRR